MMKLAIAIITAAFLSAANAAPGNYVPGEVIVKQKVGVPNKNLDNLVHQMHGKSIKEIKELKVHIIQVPKGSEEAVVKALSHNPNIKYAEQNMIVEPAETIPNDPKYSSQWHLLKMQTPNAWDLSTGSGVIIGICDTGTQNDHPDLAANIVPGWNVVSNNNDSSPVHQHGTATAGTAAAIANNGVGIASVSYDSKILPVRITNDTSGWANWGDISNGIIWAANHGAKVVNVSYNLSLQSNLIDDAAKYLISKGGILITAAGNDNTDYGFIDNPYIVSVSATDSNDNKASWSNFGKNVDLSAPGVNIYTTWVNSGYGSANGTSFSSPNTAGVAALVISANPKLNPYEVESILETTADDLGTPGYDIYFGYGRVNAYKAVQAALDTQIPVDTVDPTINITSPSNGAVVSGQVFVTVTANDNIAVSKVNLKVNSINIGDDTLAPYSFSFDSSSLTNEVATITATAYDEAGNSASDVIIVNVNNLPPTKDTDPPTIRFTDIMDGETVSGNVSITATATDNIGVKNIYVYVDNRLLCSSVDSDTAYCRWNTRKETSGNHIIKAIAYDAAGNSNQVAATLIVSTSSKGNRK